jgi:hypothetical protein
MRFMVLIKSNAQSEAGVLPDEKMLSAMGEYNDELDRAGIMLAGEGLQPSAKGARVRLAQGKTRNIDGPFAEAKELVGGYWILQFPSYEEALTTLKRAPFPNGEIEIRPLYEPEDFAVAASEQPGGWRDQEVAARAEAAQGALPPRIPGTRRYLSFLKADKYTEAGDEPVAELLEEMGGLIEEMTKAGVMLSGDGLKPSREGKRIVYDGGKRTVVDGPFAETKELIAGVCLMQTRTLAEALDWSRRMLEIHARGVGLQDGEVEVRALFELSDIPVDPKEKPDGWRAQEQAFRERIGQ